MGKDIFLYNGPIQGYPTDFKFIEFIEKEKKYNELILLLVTPGGDPDAAYRIGRYIQSKYDKFACLVSGMCKSAGTLLSIAADEIVFSAYGELGPLDVQISTIKADGIIKQDSGLDLSETIMSLENRASRTFHKLMNEIMLARGGVTSMQTAASCAAEIVSSLYSPILGKIDPEEVGQRLRAMRIGCDYGRRLNKKYRNIKEVISQDGSTLFGSDPFGCLSETYSSHSFVIDFEEAKEFFKNIRMVNSAEQALLSEIGTKARVPNFGVETFENLGDVFSECVQHSNADPKKDDEIINGGKNAE